jgi:hypothetical protein
VTGALGKLHELHNLYSAPSIIKTIAAMNRECSTNGLGYL